MNPEDINPKNAEQIAGDIVSAIGQTANTLKELHEAIGETPEDFAGKIPEKDSEKETLKTKLSDWKEKIEETKVDDTPLLEAIKAFEAFYDQDNLPDKIKGSLQANYEIIKEEEERLQTALECLGNAKSALEGNDGDPAEDPKGAGAAPEPAAEDDPAEADERPAKVGLMSGSLSVSYARKFSIDTTVSSTIQVEMVPYPAPSAFLEALRQKSALDTPDGANAAADPAATQPS